MRRFAQPRLAAAALFGFLAACAPAAADELVKFASAGQGDPIQGYLTKPKGAGPFPAVVLLHTCLGLPEARASIGQRIAAWGYVALFVDDFATRGLKETCAVDFQQALPDAYGAQAYLASLPYVDRARIAAVGFSQGGDTALKIATGGGAGPAGGGGAVFKAAAAFYPPCANVAGATLVDPDAHSRRREGRGDSRGGLRRAGEAAASGHGEARRLSRRGPRLRHSRVRRRNKGHGDAARL